MNLKTAQNSRKYFILFVIVILSLFIISLIFFEVTQSKSSSNTSPAQKFESIIASSPICKTPCWHGLTPGKTTEAEFLLFANSEVATSRFDKLHKNELPDIFYFWNDLTLDLPVEIRINNDNKISHLAFPAHSLTFKTVVDQLGYPDPKSSKPLFQFRKTSLTMRQRLTPAITCSATIRPEDMHRLMNFSA